MFEKTRRAATERSKAIRNVLALILAANWLVAASKLLFGRLAHSASMTADGLHSFLDGSSNIIGLVAMSIAARPADEDHPYGHGKFEALASLGIGAMVGIGMLELGRMAFDAIVHDLHPKLSPEVVAVLVFTLIANIITTVVERRAGEKLKSELLLADARHTLSDVFVTLAVLSSFVLVHFGVPRADGFVSLIVMGFVARVAYRIVQQAVGTLSDTARLDPARVAGISSTVTGVLLVRDIRSRGMEESVYVDLTIEVDPALPTQSAHELAHQVERVLTSHFPQVVDVVVHVEPGTSEPTAATGS